MKGPAKKIVMLIPSFYPNKMGGSEIQALRLSKKLVERGLQVLVFTVNYGDLPRYENVEGVEVIRVSGKMLTIPRGIQFLQKRFPIIRKKIKREILEEYGKPNDTAGYLLARIFYRLCLKEMRQQKITPSFIQINTVEWVSVTGALLAQELDVPLLIKDSTVNGLAKLKMMPWVRKCRRWIIEHSFFVAVSSMIKRELLAEGVQERRVFTIANGIEIGDCLPRNDGIVANSCLFVGNLYQEPAKGFSILLDAWSLVVQHVKDAVLNVVGDGDIERYKKLIVAKKLEHNVILWGKQLDIKRFYASNEIFVLSSIREGMSNSLIEAMNYGLPCVSTKVSGSTDLIAHMNSGLLVQPKNVVALSEAIIFLLSNKHLHKNMGLKAKDRVRQLCDINIVSAQYSNVYEALSLPNLLHA